MNETPIYYYEPGLGERVISTATASESGVSTEIGAATRPGRTLLSRFGTVMLPFAAAAAFAAPPWESRMRTNTSRASIKHVGRFDESWSFDAFTYYEEPADIEQVYMLNKLLALPAATGIHLDIYE
jgi:hypothetical protein